MIKSILIPTQRSLPNKELDASRTYNDIFARPRLNKEDNCRYDKAMGIDDHKVVVFHRFLHK